MNPQFLFGLAVFTAIAVPAFVIARRGHKKRTAGYTAAAEAAGYTYLGVPDRSIRTLVFRAASFSGGSQKTLKHAVQGTHDGIDFIAVELKEGGQTTVYRSVLCVKIDPRRIPPFELRAEATAGDWLAKFFGADDIDFEDDERFSKRYVLKAGDEHAVRRLFTRALRKRLAQSNGRPSVEAIGGWLICSPGFSQRLDPAELETFVGRAHHLVEPLLDAAGG